MKRLIYSLALCTLCACAFDADSNPVPPSTTVEETSPTAARKQDYLIVKRHKHYPKAFTQGLLFDNKGQLLESSGNYGESYIARLHADSASSIQQQIWLPKHFFAEGIALHDNRLFALTWRSGTALVYEPESLNQLKTYSYKGEGWGLTANKDHLIMSNGSDQLQFRNPDSFTLERTLNVRRDGKSVYRINELEWAEGLVYANIWYADIIVAIDPGNGNVVHTVDLSGLRHAQGKQADALNGIAYNENSGNFWVTGKYWRYVYEIKLVDARVKAAN